MDCAVGHMAFVPCRRFCEAIGGSSVPDVGIRVVEGVAGGGNGRGYEHPFHRRVGRRRVVVTSASVAEFTLLPKLGQKWANLSSNFLSFKVLIFWRKILENG